MNEAVKEEMQMLEFFEVTETKDKDGFIVEDIGLLTTKINKFAEVRNCLIESITKMCEKPTPLGVGWIAQR